MPDSKEPSRFANSFNRNIVTWSAVSVMAVMITLVAVALHEEYAALIRGVALDTEIRARLLEENARQSMRRVELLATQAAADVMRGDDFPGTDLSDLRRRLRLHLPADGLVSAFAIVGRDGATILSTDTLDPRSLPSAAERDYFTAQRDNTGLGVVVGDPAAYGVHGTWAMPISVRISGPGGTFLGVLVAQVEGAYFQAFYDSVHTGVGGFVTLFTRTGWIVARSPYNEAVLRRDWTDSPMFREHLPASKVRTVRQVFASDGIERIFTYRALEDFPLIVLAGDSLTDILAPWRKDAWRGAILLAVILVALAGGASWLSREVRGRELAEVAARSEHDRLELTTSAVGVATWDYDLASGEVIITGALDKIIAHSSRTVRTRFSDLIKLLHPDDVQPVRHALVELVKGLRAELVVEHRMRERSGEWRWLSTRATVVGRDAAGRAVRLVGTNHDVTARKQAESELIGVLEAAPDAMVLVNGDGNIVLLNSAVENVFGFAKQELVGKSVDLLIPERLRHGHRGFRKQYFAEAKTRAMGAGKSLIGLRKDGSEFPAEISLSMLKTNRGGLAIAAIRDVTERAETEHQLRESAGKLRLLSRRLVQTQEAERQNLGRELHDRVGQDLTALSINLDILFGALGEEVDAEFRRRLADCLALVDSTSHSIEDVLADLRPPLLEDYGLGDALRWYAKKFSQRTLIAVELHEPEGHLFAKRPVRDTALFRIVQGALTNVAEHAGANRVEIAIRVSGGALVLDVSDNGRGFVPSAQTIERPGWGLRTMYERAEAIDARLSVSSAPGRGTTVTVTAPL